MTGKQHSAAALPGQTLRILNFNFVFWGAIAMTAFWVGHGSLDSALAGPLFSCLAWAVLAAAEYVAQPVEPQPVAAEDSPWRVLASRVLFTVVPVSSWDAKLSAVELSCGIALLLLGGGLRWWALKTLGPQFTWTAGLVADHKLVREGPYRYLKHPNYLGSVVFAAGIVLSAGSRFGWVPVTAMAIAVVLAARHESAYLRGRLQGYR